MRSLWLPSTLVLLLAAGAIACSPADSDHTPEPEVEATAPVGGEAPTTIDDPFAYTDQLLSRREAALRVEGEVVMGDASATFVAWLEDHEPVLIEERVSLGDYGHEQSRYVLARGQLVLYESSGTRTITDPALPAGQESLEVVLTFDVDGRPRFTAMTVDGRSVEIDETRIQGAVARAATLRRAALDAATRSG